MRKSFREVYSDLGSLPNRREILTEKAVSPQEAFLQVLGNIVLDSLRE